MTGPAVPITPTTAALPLPALFNQSMSWKHFLDRITNTFTYCNVQDPAVKKSYLIASLGDEVLNLLYSLCLSAEPGAKTLEELVQLLSNHFKPIRSVFASRRDFYAAKQTAGESAVGFSARVRSLATYCKFGVELDCVMRDCFILGLHNPKIREQLLEEDPTDPRLTFTRVVELASTKEAALKGKAEGETTVKTEPLDFMKGRRKAKSFNASEPCSVCGRKNHKSSECQFKRNSCYRCNQKGHLAPVCRNKPKKKRLPR